MTENEAHSLEELENDVWPAPQGEATRLIERVHELRRVPLSELTTEDLRLLILQEIGLDHLLPLAVRHLRVEPLLDAELYPGDLLSAVLQVRYEYWRSRPSLAAQIDAIVNSINVPPIEIQQHIRSFTNAGRPGHRT